MKTAMKRLIRDETGQALIMALILLLVGGLIIGPLLSYMSTGLITGGVYEKKADELYAADAGAEDAVLKLQNGEVELCPGQNHTPYNIADVNGKSVDVTISSFYGVGNLTMAYHVESIATGNGSGTKIEAYIVGVNKYGDYEGLLDQIITSQGEIDVANKVILDYPEGCGPAENYTDPWPTAEELAEFYWEDVEDAVPYALSTLYVQDYPSIGPFYRDGPLDIVNSGATNLTLQLSGTVYITGQTKIGSTGQDFTLDLNGQTIFVSDNTTGSQKALILGGKCVIKGPGVIVAVGDIEFKPQAQAGEEEGGGPLFVLSISGTTTLQPSGTIYGSIAGGVEVNVQQGEEPTITYPEGGFDDCDLNFLIGIKKLIFHIASWEVSPL